MAVQTPPGPSFMSLHDVWVNTGMARPPGRKQTKVFQMRVDDEFLERVDIWRAKQRPIPSRAEAIREMVKVLLDIVEKDRG